MFAAREPGATATSPAAVRPHDPTHNAGGEPAEGRSSPGCAALVVGDLELDLVARDAASGVGFGDRQLGALADVQTERKVDPGQ